MSKVAIVIPSYEPDERLTCLVNDLLNNGLGPIYIVNDGSGSEYDSIFESITEPVKASGGAVLQHEVNRGKGRALKTAFEYILNNDKDVEFVVTADSDGQHTCECIQRVIDASLKNRKCMVVPRMREIIGNDIVPYGREPFVYRGVNAGNKSICTCKQDKYCHNTRNKPPYEWPAARPPCVRGN